MCFTIAVMLTKNDLSKLTDIFVTRTEFCEEIASLKSELRNDFMTRFDEVMGELKAIREELAVSLYRQREHTDQLEELDRRVTKLEHAT